MSELRFLPCGDSAITVEFAKEMHESVNRKIRDALTGDLQSKSQLPAGNSLGRWAEIALIHRFAVPLPQRGRYYTLPFGEGGTAQP